MLIIPTQELLKLCLVDFQVKPKIVRQYTAEKVIIIGFKVAIVFDLFKVSQQYVRVQFGVSFVYKPAVYKGAYKQTILSKAAKNRPFAAGTWPK